MMNHMWKPSRYVPFIFSGACVLLVLLEATTAQAITYYVATTGDDANPGTLNQPFKSFAQSIRMLQPGDTLYIRGGTYTEQMDFQSPNKTGTATGWITIAGYIGETVTIRYSNPATFSYGPIKARGARGYFIFDNLVLDGTDLGNKTGWSIRDGNHHFILRNLKIKNFTRSGLYITANDVQVINCTIYDQLSISGEAGERHYGIYFREGSNGVIEGNDIYNNPGGGIQAYPGPISNLVIHNNSIHHNNSLASSPIGGIILQGSSSNVTTNTKIYNNLVYSNGSSPTSGGGSGIEINVHTSGTMVWHNTVYGNKKYGIQVGGNSTTVNTVVQNNIIYDNKIGNYVDSGTTTTYDHNLTTDPRFSKVDAFDFRLQADSPAVDGGIALNQVTRDIKNQPRPKGRAHDIGAHEGDGSDLHSVTPPRNVSIK